MSKALFISGGGTKIPFLGASASRLITEYDYNFNTIVGVSAGAILSLPLAMGLHEEMKDMVISQTDKSIFKYSPNTWLGKVVATLNVLSGKGYLLNDSRLAESIKSVVTKERFNKYKYNRKMATCYVVVVDIETGEELLVNLKTLSYDQAIEYVLASSSIPVYVGPRKINDRYLYDGGMRSHIGSYLYLKENGDNVKECVSIFSRANDLETYKWEYPKKKWFSFNILKVLSRTIEIMNIEISKSDEYKADYYCDERGIKHHKIFAPFKLSNNPYENGKTLNMTMWKKGVEEVDKNALTWNS